MRIALLDEDIEVRLFAAGILGRLEDEFAIKIKDKVFKHDLNPNDKFLGFDLAQFYVTYAESGLLDDISKYYYYNEALRILSTLSQDVKYTYLKAHIYYEIGDYEKAKNDIKECLDTDGDNPAYQQLIMETLFALKDYDAFVSMLKKVDLSKIEDFKKYEVVNFWA